MRGNMTGAQTNLENQEMVFWEVQFKRVIENLVVSQGTDSVQ